MKVAVLTTQVPFVYGGAEFLVDSLASQLRNFGHQAEVIRLPFKWNPAQKILDHMLAARLVRLWNVDQVIAIKFPAYFVPHERKVVWLVHQFRQAYDLWGTIYQDIPDTPEGRTIRNAIIQSDNKFLSEAKRIYTNSKVVSERLKRFNGIESEVLYPPLMDAEQYQCGEFQDYVFYPSRITRGKRQHLAVEAMRHVKSRARLVIAGRGESLEDLKQLESMIKRYGLEHKVQLLGGWISQAEKARLFAACLGCLYIPYDEDSYGYVTLESFQSHKPVITCVDSGGTLEIVEDKENGFVTAPDPHELARAIDRMIADPNSAARMGQAGYEKMLSLNISWSRVIEALVQ